MFANHWLQRMLAAEAISRHPEFAIELTSVENRTVLLLAAWVSAQTHGRAAALQAVIGNYLNPREHTHWDWMIFLTEVIAQFATGKDHTSWTVTTKSVLEQKLFGALRACPFVDEQITIGRALALLGSQQALAYCQGCLAGESDLYPAERVVLIQQLRWFANRAAVLALAREATKTDNPEVIRAEAVAALCQIPSSEGIAVLRDLMASSDDAQRRWLVQILSTSRQSVARFFLLTHSNRFIGGAFPRLTLEPPDSDTHDRLKQGRTPGNGSQPSAETVLQRKTNLTDSQLIEQLIGTAHPGHLHERHAAAFLLNRVPPQTDVQRQLNKQAAKNLLKIVETEPDAESRWAAYRVLKLGAAPESFTDLIRFLEQEHVNGQFPARAVIDILASRQFLCQVVESRSKLDSARLLLMLRFGFHIGADYSAMGKRRAVFLLRDGRVSYTCAELKASLDRSGGYPFPCGIS